MARVSADCQEWRWISIETAYGRFLAAFSASGLARLVFPGFEGAVPGPKGGLDSWAREWAGGVDQWLHRALKGEPADESIPLDLSSSGTSFQQAVWWALKTIPVGETRSYGQLARAVGSPQAVRAVGRACGANPIPILIPCHRVLRRGGDLGGYSSGLDWKRFLLNQER